MKKYIIIGVSVVVILILAIVLFTHKGKSIVGKWESVDQKGFIYTFNEDNTCSYNKNGKISECTYTIRDNTLAILFKGNTTAFETNFEIKSNKLNIHDSYGKDTIYNKVKEK